MGGRPTLRGMNGWGRDGIVRFSRVVKQRKREVWAVAFSVKSRPRDT